MDTIFYRQISANQRNSFLIALFIVVLFGLLGFTIGYVFFGGAGRWRWCDSRWPWARFDHRTLPELFQR